MYGCAGLCPEMALAILSKFGWFLVLYFPSTDHLRAQLQLCQKLATHYYPYLTKKCHPFRVSTLS